MKANLLKKITLNTLITMNIEEKRNLGLKSTVGGVQIEPYKFNYNGVDCAEIEPTTYRLRVNN